MERAREDPRRDGPAEPPRSDVRISGALRCPYCHADVNTKARDWVACRACLARHHDGCWTENRSCATCGSLEVLASPRPAAAASRKRSPVFLAVSVAAALFGVIGVQVSSGIKASEELRRARVEVADVREQLRTADTKVERLTRELAAAREVKPEDAPRGSNELSGTFDKRLLTDATTEFRHYRDPAADDMLRWVPVGTRLVYHRLSDTLARPGRAIESRITRTVALKDEKGLRLSEAVDEKDPGRLLEPVAWDAYRTILPGGMHDLGTEHVLVPAGDFVCRHVQTHGGERDLWIWRGVVVRERRKSLEQMEILELTRLEMD